MDSQRIKWIGSGIFSKYFCFYVPLFIIIIGLIMSIVRLNEIMQNGIPTAFFILFPPMFLLSGLSLRAIIKNGKLLKTGIFRPLPELRISLKKQLEQAGWKVNRSNAQYLTAHKTESWFQGTKIAILFSNKEAYINVQNLYGTSAYFPFSFGRNKTCTNMVIRLIITNEE